VVGIESETVVGEAVVGTVVEVVVGIAVEVVAGQVVFFLDQSLASGCWTLVEVV